VWCTTATSSGGPSPAPNSLAHVGDERNVSDDCIGDAAPGVAQHDGVADADAEKEAGMNPGVDAGDHENLATRHLGELATGIAVVGEGAIAVE